MTEVPDPPTAPEVVAGSDTAPAISEQSPTLADKLQHLFATVHPAGGKPYSDAHVARAIEDAGGPKMSGQFIWLLRHGQRTNPTVKNLEAIAQFFGVSIAYFADDEYAARVDADLRLLSSLREAGVGNMLTRATDLARLSDTSRAAIGTMIDQALRIEGMTPTETPAGGPGNESPGE